jgi:hypothetical protein
MKLMRGNLSAGEEKQSDIENRFENVARNFGYQNEPETKRNDASKRECRSFLCRYNTARGRRRFTILLKIKTAISRNWRIEFNGAVMGVRDWL